MMAERPLMDVARTYGAVAALCLVVGRLRALPGADAWAGVVVSAAFLFCALHRARRLPGGAESMGIALGGILEAPADEASGGGFAGTLRRALPLAARETGVALGLAALTFPPFILGYAIFFDLEGRFGGAFDPALLEFALAQVLLIALPEEAFFRGFVQTRLAEAFPAGRFRLGPSLSVRAMLGQATLFALVHFLVIPQPTRLAVFFPALLFGFLRAWRGGIGAALVYHAACNILAEVLLRHFR